MADIITNLNEGAAGLAEFKEELGAAIEEKGVTVDPEQPLATYVGRVRAIPAADGDYVTNAELEAKDYVTNTELEGKGYVTDTELEGKDYITNAELGTKGFVTTTELEGKDYVTGTELEEKDYVTNADLEGKDYVTNADLENLPMGGGNHIGSIFAYPSATPPEGAYLLNGQTITNCKTLYPEFYEWANSSGVRKITATTYESEIAQYGICGAFVVSENDVRLPLWKGYQTPLGDNVPVRGNGMTLGLSNGSQDFGLNYSSYSDYGVFGATSAYGTDVGSNATSGGPILAHLSIGVTEDSDKSGIIVDTGDYPQDAFHWCIQVFNAATELSQQESAQLASQMQMKAQTDLANVTEPVQAFKDMAIDWGMPDYTAGVDITAHLSAVNSEYTVPYDCCIIHFGGSGSRGYIMSQPGVALSSGTAASKYILSAVDTEAGIGSSNALYCSKGTVLYTSTDIPITGNAITLYPLKGADK
jgi:hypothetical protein